MSLSPLVSFKSRFVTYLLNFPRIYIIHGMKKIMASMSNIEHMQRFCLAQKKTLLGTMIFQQVKHTVLFTQHFKIQFKLSVALCCTRHRSVTYRDILIRKLVGKRRFVRYMHRWQNNIQIHFKELRCKEAAWIHFVQDFVKTVKRH